MSVDAVFLLRAKDASAASTVRARGLHVRELGDGSMLVHSMMGIAGFQRDPTAAAVWLNGFADRFRPTKK